MTRKQEDLTRALDHIGAMASESEATRTIYGSLCHALPALIRTSGLCEALAFVHEKAAGGGDRGAAHARMWEHVAATLGVPPHQLLEHVRTRPSLAYLRDTVRVLEASVYYKRFAVSLLGVEPGEEPAA